ncbi:hypothetical protein LTR85_003144 [Meristemomyces frigidus]|nr:hypothetical protein LTR85_003144 [Meristemomyces frigidus]
MSSSTSSVDYTFISGRVYVPRHDNNPHNRHDAAHFIQLGYTVHDEYGRELTIETRPDGTRRVVIGEDLLAAHNERIAQAAEAGAAGTDASGRPVGLLPRPLTDYEAGRRHVAKDCTLIGCDHPAHFGGDEIGNLVITKVDPKTKKDDLKDKKRDDNGGAGGAGAVGGGVTGGSKVEKA